jgi:hypothetical protein
MHIQQFHAVRHPRDLWIEIRSHWTLLTLTLLVVASFLLKAPPLLQHQNAAGDPYVHYQYSMALLNGELSIPVKAGTTGNMVDLYYPPLFHLVSLGFFLAFPSADPYIIMKILACTIDALQVVPIYLIVKRISGSSVGGLLASYSLIAVSNDYQMLSWGGYANIAGLLLAAFLVYAIINEKRIMSTALSAALCLTHHLSTILMFAVLVSYFALVLLMKRQVPKSFIGVVVGGLFGVVAFYRFAWQSILYFYSNFSPVYDQSVYVTPYIIHQVGPLLLFAAPAALVLLYTHARREFLRGKELLLIWAVIPFLLAYAYLLGVHWHGVRWIAFIPGPLSVWAGLGLAKISNRKMIIVAFAVLVTIQLLLTVASYPQEILSNGLI